MGWFGWLGWKSRRTEDERLQGWRREWLEACGNPDGDAIAALAGQLDELERSAVDVELEREMLEGLSDLARLQGEVARRGLPTIETQHRVIGSDACHFSAPVAMPDDPQQPAGRLLFTSRRAVFLSGASATLVPWHAVAKVIQDGRDFTLVRADRANLYRFRCNSFGDALCGAFLARQLTSRTRR